MSKPYPTRVFIIEDDPIFGRSLQFRLEREGNYEISLFTDGRAFKESLHLNPDIVSIDCNLPDTPGLELLKLTLEHDPDIPCIMVSGQEAVDMVVNCYRNGARDYIVKSANAPDELLASVKKFQRTVQQKKELEDLRSVITDRTRYMTLVGESPALLAVIRLLQKIERTNIMVLITGQSGTGKEVVARNIHYNSLRKKENYVAVNMAAIPSELIESELFGHEKGSFTGADSRRIGKFEEANHGTIFLDEIGEMDLNMQTKLLRVLQENTITRVGSNKEIKLDVRVIAATNKNLLEMVKAGKFREDLYYRLQGFLIHLPPLKERGEDVILLGETFLNDFILRNRMPSRFFGEEAKRAMLQHDWPGNVRELKNVVERAAIIADNTEIGVEDIIIG